MNNLNNQQKLDLILDLCKKHHITAYEIGKNTQLNQSGVQRILKGEIKKPQSSTLDTILNYLHGVTAADSVKKSNAAITAILDKFTPEQILEYILKNEDRFIETRAYNYFIKIKLKDYEIQRLKAENAALTENKLQNSNTSQ